MSVLARLDRLPMSKPHYMLLLAGGLGYTFDAMDISLVGFLLPTLSKEWGLSNSALGLLGAAAPFGYLFGALIAGMLGDRFGRKPVMLCALLVYTAFTLVGAIAPNFEVFALARILAGVGIGAESAIIAPYLSEFVPPHKRGWFTGSLAGFFAFGFVLSALIGRFIVPLPNGWRWAQVICVVPIFMVLWWRRSLSESPRYLLAHGRAAEADTIVTKFEAKVRKATGRELPQPASGVQDKDLMVSNTSFRAAFKFVLSAGMRRRTLVVWGIWFVNVFGSYGFFTWIPTLLVQRGIDITKSFDFSIIIFAAQIPGYFSAAWVSEWLDRKYTIAVYLLGGAASAYWLSQAPNDLTVLISGAVLSFFMTGATAATYAYTPELFPTWARASATGLASSIARIGSISAPVIIGAISLTWGFAGVFGLTSGIMLAGVIAVMVFGPKARGRSLEELNEEANTSVEQKGEITPATHP